MPRCHDFGKVVLLHFDLLHGLSADADAVAFVTRRWRADGIITTRPQVIAAASRLGVTTIQRIFALDSLALQTGIQLARQNQPSAIEVLPGIVPRAITQLVAALSQPVIAGGLVQDAGDVSAALGAGAQAVSTSREALWAMAAAD